MTRKQFIQLADIFKECKQDSNLDYETVAHIQGKIMDFCAMNNGRFDRGRFMDWTNKD